LLKRRNDDAVLDWMRRSVSDSSAYMRRLAALDETELSRSTDTLALTNGSVLERVALPQRSRGRMIGRVYSFRDVTERLETMRRIDALSHSDALTGLPNRACWPTASSSRSRWRSATARRSRCSSPTRPLQAHQRHARPRLRRPVLIDVAERLKACLRQVDTVTRLAATSS
jgi:hypothetical protein